ncbi:PEP/pyruvate-binding domain-containing protein [Desulfobacterales bacterium HSG16]|nr:PEP/pyruvate-binding domain-containing protein [Desulfobacterales bacterium HSG16]
MVIEELQQSDDSDLSFKVFHELMPKRVNDILLVSSRYDAYIMEEEGRLAERLIHEYRGLNLTCPPRITMVSTTEEAFSALNQQHFDLVFVMPRMDDMDLHDFGIQVKNRYHNIPIFLLVHNTAHILGEPRYSDKIAIDRQFVWSGNADLLLAIIKNVEDGMNVEHDTQRARVRVIIMVENSPAYYSSFLPLLYKVIVKQTKAVMEESLNEEHRILRMRIRPKILVAENYEEAIELYNKYRPYLLSVFTDVRYPVNGRENKNAGFMLTDIIKKETCDLPILIFSSEEENRKKARDVPAVFLNKNSPSLHMDIRSFFVKHLGFGDFIFRMPDGKEVARATNMRIMERVLPSIPEESVYYHAMRNDFSSWLMARSEINLASLLRPVKASDFSGPQELKEYLISCIHEQRKDRQKGVITDFLKTNFDPETDFLKIRKGSIGGKARGLAFISTLLKEQEDSLKKKFPGVSVYIPKTLVISTEGFEFFISKSNLKDLPDRNLSDKKIAEIFLKTQYPSWLMQDLKFYLSQVHYPIAVRSSSLLEDAQYQSRAGIYSTYMLPNNHKSLKVRLKKLIDAVKLVYASTYMETSTVFARSTSHRPEEEKMAVIIQQLAGTSQGVYFYPAISGVAQSYNFYPMSYMKPEEGIVHIAVGLGRTVVSGEAALRFSPCYPQFLPQFSSVDDILKNSQRSFYALNLSDFPIDFGLKDDKTLTRLQTDDEIVKDHFPLKTLCSTYIPADHRIRDTTAVNGCRVLTFANILKYNSFPLPEIISELLETGRKGMGCPVEIEFAVNFFDSPDRKPEFALLQIRPMALTHQNMEVKIVKDDIKRCVCYSNSALGNGNRQDIADIIFIKPEAFDPARTVEQAAEIGNLNKVLVKEDRKYLLIGPGRWGSADRWLGIPVTWNNISGVGAIIETSIDQLKADPSQGSHFFNNITSLGISYLTVSVDRNTINCDTTSDFIKWEWLDSLPVENETRFLRHVRLKQPLSIKVDGKKSCAVVLPE